MLELLAAAPPEFGLPYAAATHTRSYLNANTKDPTDKNLVFDPFVVFERDKACFLHWPGLQLSSQDRETLSALLRNMNYLGRSESWVEAELWEGDVESPMRAAPSEIAGPTEELGKVACAVPSAEYAGKQAWMEALTFSTANLLKQRASAPPLLRQLGYAVPKNAVAVDPRRPVRSRPGGIEAVILGLDATVLPLVTATIEVAEQIRVRLMGAHKKIKGDGSLVSDLFSGKNSSGEKRLDHGHVYILPLASGDQRRMGRIDRILIVSPLRPFREDEMDAIRCVRELWQREGRPTVECVVSWQGKRQQVPGSRLVTVVESATPFVPPRHWRKGRDFDVFLEEEVRRECHHHHIDTPITRIEPDKKLSLYHESEYRRNRKDDPVRPGYRLRLTFADEVRVPFAIGYGAHFGLGQFRAER